jgi:hypothetical protein
MVSLRCGSANNKGRKLILPLYSVARECFALYLLQSPFQKRSPFRRRPEVRHGFQWALRQ